MIAPIAFALAASLAQPSDPPTEVHVWVSRDVVPGKNVRLTINTRNLPAVRVEAFPVDGEAWLSRFHKPNARPRPTGPSVRSWTVTVRQPGQETNAVDRYYSRQVNLPIEMPGVYLIHVGGEGKMDSAVVNVTNLAVVAKRSPYRSLVWVTDHRSGRVVPEAQLHFYDGYKATHWDSATGADGARLLELAKTARILVVRHGRDLAGISVDAADFDGRLNAFWQTDRPIYRPGQSLMFKTVLRRTHGQGYDALTGREVKVQLCDPRDTPVDEAVLRSNDFGSVEGSFSIPTEGMLGAYTLKLFIDKDVARQTVTVAEYRKPEFKVDVAPLRDHYLAGETLKFELHAGYYFGAPLPQARVTWLTRSSYLPFAPVGREESWFYGGDGNLYPRDTYAAQPVAGEGQDVTDNKGDITISVPSDPHAEDTSYGIQATVIDATNRQVGGSASVPVYSSELRLSIQPELQCVALGGLIPVQIRVTDLQGRPVAAKVRLRVLHQVYDEKKDRWFEKELTAMTFSVPSSGRARATLPALAEGDLTLEASTKDSTGRQARDQATVWAQDPNYKPPKEKVEPQLIVRLDKRMYEPGDEVKAFISSNVAPRPTLVVEEGLDIWAYKVFDSSSISYRFKTDKRMSPNAFLSATAWAEHHQIGNEKMVPLPDLDRQISIAIYPDKAEYRPGDKATIQVVTKDRHGRPVPSEVCLAVVDEAIFALSPDTTGDPYAQYWGMRGNHVQTMVSAPEEVSGGAYQRASQATPTVRQRFEDTAYWKAFVDTGSDGRGVATFEMPGNLTTWRATARAFTPETMAGAGRTSMLATRPLTLRLALPRQMTNGDTVLVSGTVNNRTAEAATVHVRLTGDLETFSLSGPADQRVDVPANGQTVVPWMVHVDSRHPAGGTATFQAEAMADRGGQDMTDALRVSVPVVPRGYRSVSVAGGLLERSGDIAVTLPPDVSPDRIKLQTMVFQGVGAAASQAAASVLNEHRYGTTVGADQLMVAATLGPDTQRETVREDIALLSRNQAGNGWGWWEGCPPGDVITAEVARALAHAKAAKIPVPEFLINTARYGCQQFYNQSQLWDHRALLAASLTELGFDDGRKLIMEVIDHGIDVSPYGHLRMAEALSGYDMAAASAQLNQVLSLVSHGANSSYLPVGYGIGWTADSTQTTAELLSDMCELKERGYGGAGLAGEIEPELVRWLLSNQDPYACEDVRTEVFLALHRYLEKHPESPTLGEVTMTAAGQKMSLTASRVDASASAVLYGARLQPGRNILHFERTGDGEAMVSVEIEGYRPAPNESHQGVRIARKFEVRNPAGVWMELDRAVKTGEPVRVTLSVWGDDIPDAVKVDEPIPAGFEFVDSEARYGMREEVRDGKLVHYLMNAGSPTVIRYYLRSEAPGTLTASAPSAQYLRRPDALGHGIDLPIEVVNGK